MTATRHVSYITFMARTDVAEEHVAMAIFVSDLFLFANATYVQRLSLDDDAFDIAVNPR